MINSLAKHLQKVSLIATSVAALVLSPMTTAGVIVNWDFEQAPVGQRSQIQASYTSSLVTNAFFNTTASGVEQWGTAPNTNRLALTRFFDSNNNVSWLTFTLNQDISNLSLSFNQTSNHNPGFPTNRGYNFAVQIKADDVWKDIKRDLVAQRSTFGQKIDLNVASTLKAGTYQIRWIGYNYSTGNNSGTEFFGLDNVKMYTASEPAALGLLGLAMLGFYRRKRQVTLQAPAA